MGYMASYYKIPKPIFYLLKGDYRALGSSYVAAGYSSYKRYSGETSCCTEAMQRVCKRLCIRGLPERGIPLHTPKYDDP